MKNPEKTAAYRNGAFCRRTGKIRDANPYPFLLCVEHHLWLAGWHDKDMEMNPKSDGVKNDF